MRRRATDPWAGRFGVWVVAVGMAAACGGTSNEAPPMGSGSGATGGRMTFTVGGVGGSAGSGSGGKAGGGSAGDTMSEGGEGGVVDVPDPLSPIVEVTSPPGLESPEDGDVLVDDEVDVVCEARPAEGGEPIDPSLVAIQLLDADENVIDEVAASPSGSDEYTATLILAQVPESGPVGFRCTAGDRSVPPLVGSDTAWSLVDHGPIIEVVSPEHDSVHGLLSPVAFEFRVVQSPVTSDDPDAAVESVTLEVNSVEVDPGAPDDEGRYTVAVDLDDEVKFGTVPTGTIAFTIRATNGRTPEAVERVVSDSFVLDGTGPEIAITTPEVGDVVGSQITVDFTVTDALSTIDPDSVVVSVNGIESRYAENSDSWERPTANRFVCKFDSTEAGASAFQVTVNAGAQDAVGNASNGTSRQVYLDSHPPIVDLVPPNVREWREVSSGIECSLSFDPLGEWAPDDLEVVDRSIFPRVLVWEVTNDIGQMYLHYAGTDEGSVVLYIQTDPTKPLLIDSNGDTVCDEIDNSYTGAVAGKVGLKPINPAGNPWWGAGDETTEPATGSFCDLAAETEPDHLCTSESSDLTRVIAHDYISTGHSRVVVFGGDNKDEECTGTDWEMGPQAPGEGWVCFAARAQDHGGNVGVSRPIRLCFDDLSNTEEPGCKTDPNNNPPPTCMNDCTPPAAFTSPLYLEH